MTQLMDLVNNKRENIPDQSQGRSKKRLPPIVLLHGFDSSCIEYRRLAPLLATLSDRDVYVPDILGWGYALTHTHSYSPAFLKWGLKWRNLGTLMI